MLTLGRLRDIREEADGVHHQVDLFDGLPQLLMEGLRSGTYRASFVRNLSRTSSGQAGEVGVQPRGIPESVVTELALKELGPTPVPAYHETTAENRSLNDEFMPARVAVPRLSSPFIAEPKKPAWELEESKPYWLLETKGVA